MCEAQPEAQLEAQPPQYPYWLRNERSLSGNWLGERSYPECEPIQCRFSSVSLWVVAIIIIIIIAIAGALLHELYTWTGNNQFVGYFSPVNESVWEHLKLIYVPFVIAGLILWFIIGKNTGNYIYSLALAILLACIFIVVVFYTYTGATGVESVIIDIIIFVLAVILGVWLFYWLVTQPTFPNWTTIVGWVILIALGIAFIAFTYNAPNIPLFTDPTQE